MSQVLFVSQLDGRFSYRDVDGSDITDACNTLSESDADVLFQRLIQGYIELPKDHYAVRMKYRQTSHKETDGQMFEFTNIVTHGPNETVVLQDVVLNNTLRSMLMNGTYRDDMVIKTSVGFVDFDKHVISWIHNPISDDPLTHAFDNKAGVAVGNDKLTILHKAACIFNERLPQHVELIELNVSG